MVAIEPVESYVSGTEFGEQDRTGQNLETESYVYRTEFGVVSDHKALQSVLKSNKGNKTFSSRLTRWVGRLLPFEFAVIHTVGRTLGMVDYLSRHPSQNDGLSMKAEEIVNDWVTINVVKEVAPKLHEAVLAN